MTAPPRETDHRADQGARTCRVAGCQKRARLRGFCPPCWSDYLTYRRQAEAQLALGAIGCRPEVEEGLVGVPQLWDAMALNLAAWRSLPSEERERGCSDWLQALIDTLAELVGSG